MSKDKKVIPALRFPEFVNDGEWQRKPLDEILIFQTGYPFDSEGFNEEGKGVRLIKNRDLKSDDKIVHYNKPYDEKYKVSNGDILVGMDGDFTPIRWNKGTALLNQRVGRVLTKKKGDELFFLYFLAIHLKAIEEKTARTTVKHLSHSVVEKINEPLPKPQEQQKIASCLSSLDEVIVAHSQKLELLKDHKKGLMQNLFPHEGKKIPKYRFPDFMNDRDWEEKTLGQLLEFKNGINAEKEQYGRGIKFINVLDILQNEFITYDKIIGSVDIDKETIEKFSVNYGDILFQRSSETQEEVGTANVYLDREQMATFGGFVIRGKKIGEYDPVFLNKLLKSKSIRNSISSKSGGSTRFNIGQEILSSIKILLPSPKEQQKIASCLSSLDSLIVAQIEKIEQLKLHKKGLMQGVFPRMID
jgi:type I restriction enzyme S subunit